jgi:transaldolase
LRRLVEKEGADAITMKTGQLTLKVPYSIESSALLYHAQQSFAANKVDELVVTENGKVIGMLDIQDLMK